MTNEASRRPEPGPPASETVSYTQLSTVDRQRVSAVCTAYEQRIGSGDGANLEALMQSAEPHLRGVLLEQLLPVEIDYLRTSRGSLPTLHELSVLYPNLERLLETAYARLPAEVRLPDVLGVYHLVKVIDGGRQGLVGIGRHKRLLQSAAIKFSRDDESARRVMQEAKFLARLQGLNVPEVLNDGRAPDGTAYFIMPFLEGQTLEAVVQKSGRIADPEECARLVFSLADTVQQMHERQVVHRDLSHRNIHLGQDGVSRILDFGLALDTSAALGAKQDIGEFHGTPAFMAPEQLSGDGSVDPTLSDIYALGRILLYVCCGLDALVQSVACPKKEPSTPAGGAAENPSLPDDRTLQRIYLQATQPDWQQRYATAGQMADDLQRYLQSRAWWRRSQRFVLCGVLAMMLIGGVSWAVFRDRPAEPHEASLASSAPPISPALRKRLVHDDLVLAIATADEASLGGLSEADVTPKELEDALRSRNPGETQCAAASFFAASKQHPAALDWFRRSLAAGLDPNLIVPGLEHPHEALLAIAWHQENSEAMLILLEAGASPHSYQEILGSQLIRPAFFYPYYHLQKSSRFTAEDVRRLAHAFQTAGAVVPEPMKGDSDQAEAIRETTERSQERFGFALSATPPLWTHPHSPIADRAAKRDGRDWDTFLTNMPKVVWANKNSQALANGQLEVFSIRHLLGIVGDKAYFLGNTIYLTHRYQFLIETDFRAENWSFYVHGGPGLWADGQPRVDPADTYPEKAALRHFWRRYDLKYDAVARTMTVDGVQYDCYANVEQLQQREKTAAADE